MPSAKPLPTVADFLRASRNALVGERDRYGDRRSGAIYDHTTGPMAVLFARQADRDRDAFRAIYWDDAEGDDLTALIPSRTVSAQYPNGIQRILDTYGVGTCEFTRPNASGGAGTFWEGTRIVAAGNPPTEYQVVPDQAVSASKLDVVLAVQALAIGSGSAIATTSGLSLEDPVWDPSWQPVSLVCAAGTDYEDAPTYRARARALLINQRNGYETRIVQVAQAAGAQYVVLFPSNYGLAATDFDDDHGINALYVADKNFNASKALINAVAVALESTRVLGADLWVGGIAPTPLQIQAVLNLVDDPGRLDLVPIVRAAAQALLAYFTPTTAGYSYKRAGLQGVLSRSHPAIQGAGIPYQWAASQTVAVGDMIFPSPTTGNVYQCVQSGVTGSSQPAFSTVVGASTPDGTAIWSTTNYSPLLGIYQSAVRQAADPTISPLAFPATLPRYTLAPRDIILSFAGPV